MTFRGGFFDKTRTVVVSLKKPSRTLVIRYFIAIIKSDFAVGRAIKNFQMTIHKSLQFQSQLEKKLFFFHHPCIASSIIRIRDIKPCCVRRSLSLTVTTTKEEEDIRVSHPPPNKIPSFFFIVARITIGDVIRGSSNLRGNTERNKGDSKMRIGIYIGRIYEKV